jgi:UDP-glucose 4-epimerase
MTSVLVTGAAGLIGWQVTRQLLEEGHEVVVFDRALDHRNLDSVRGQAKLVQGEISEEAALRRTVEAHGIRRIVHLAGAFAPVPLISPIDLMRTNVIGTAAVFEVARDFGIERVVWASTVMADEHEDDYDFSPVDERHRISPRSLYGASKYACEVMAAEYVRAYGLDIVGIRPPTVYGPGRDTNAVNAAIREAALGGTAALAYHADTHMQPIHNVDMAAFIVVTLFSATARPTTYNTPVEAIWTGAEFVELLARLCPAATVGLGKPARYAGVAPVMDGSRARAEIGFEPRVSLEEGMQGMINAYRMGAQGVA